MKVLFCIPTLSVGGAEKVLINLVNSIDTDKFQITVMCLFDGGVNKQYLSSKVTYKYCWKHLFRGNSHILKLFSPGVLYSFFIKDRYDVVISYLEGPTARIISGCPYKECKIVSWIHCTMHTKKDFSVGFRNYKEAKKCYEKFDKCIFVSNDVKNAFLNSGCKLKGNEVIYNTNQSDMIIQKSIEDAEGCQHQAGKIRLCAVGKIIPVKGFDRLARIHYRLIQDGFRIETIVLGVGAQQKEIENYLKEHNITDSFHFLGYQINPYKYVKKSDLFVCSSLSEGFSTAVTEALIVGTPVITTDVSGMRELLGNNQYGVITANSEDALYQGIKTLITNPDLLKYYGTMSIQRGNDFKAEKTVEMVEKMLIELVNTL